MKVHRGIQQIPSKNARMKFHRGIQQIPSTNARVNHQVIPECRLQENYMSTDWRL